MHTGYHGNTTHTVCTAVNTCDIGDVQLSNFAYFITSLPQLPPSWHWKLSQHASLNPLISLRSAPLGLNSVDVVYMQADEEHMLTAAGLCHWLICSVLIFMVFKMSAGSPGSFISLYFLITLHTRDCDTCKTFVWGATVFGIETADMLTSHWEQAWQMGKRSRYVLK